MRATSLLPGAAGGALSPNRVKKPGTLLEQLCSRRYAYTSTRVVSLHALEGDFLVLSLEAAVLGGV